MTVGCDDDDDDNAYNVSKPSEENSIDVCDWLRFQYLDYAEYEY